LDVAVDFLGESRNGDVAVDGWRKHDAVEGANTTTARLRAGSRELVE